MGDQQRPARQPAPWRSAPPPPWAGAQPQAVKCPAPPRYPLPVRQLVSGQQQQPQPQRLLQAHGVPELPPMPSLLRQPAQRPTPAPRAPRVLGAMAISPASCCSVASLSGEEFVASDCWHGGGPSQQCLIRCKGHARLGLAPLCSLDRRRAPAATLPPAASGAHPGFPTSAGPATVPWGSAAVEPEEGLPELPWLGWSTEGRQAPPGSSLPITGSPWKALPPPEQALGSHGDPTGLQLVPTGQLQRPLGEAHRQLGAPQQPQPRGRGACEVTGLDQTPAGSSWCSSGGSSSSGGAGSTGRRGGWSGSSDSQGETPGFGAQQAFGRAREAISRGRILKKVRRMVLEQHRSLHDAFSRLLTVVPGERPLGRHEFRFVLARLGIGGPDSEDLFVALDPRRTGGISLMDMRCALFRSSRKVILWELRCRLLSAGIQPQNLKNALRKATSHVKASSSADLADAGGALSPTVRLDRPEWQKFCASLSLEELEADLLFSLFGGYEVGAVDLRSMFEMLREIIAPEVSLERFARRVLARYDSAQDAFNAFCCYPEKRMRWQDFHALAKEVGVSGRNAVLLWDTIALSQSSAQEPEIPALGMIADSEEKERAHSEPAEALVGEDAFMRNIVMWAPDTALTALRDQLLERFGDLGCGLTTLERKGGLARSAALTPATLDSGLQAVGIKWCDTVRVLNAVMISREDLARGGCVTLHELFHAMRNMQCGTGQALRDGTLALWQQLHAGRADWSPTAAARGRTLSHSPASREGPPSEGSELPVVQSPSGSTSAAVLRAVDGIADAAAAPDPQTRHRRRRSGMLLGGNPFAPLYRAVVTAVQRISRSRQGQRYGAAAPAPTHAPATGTSAGSGGCGRGRCSAPEGLGGGAAEPTGRDGVPFRPLANNRPRALAPSRQRGQAPGVAASGAAGKESSGLVHRHEDKENVVPRLVQERGCTGAQARQPASRRAVLRPRTVGGG